MEKQQQTPFPESGGTGPSDLVHHQLGVKQHVVRSYPHQGQTSLQGGHSQEAGQARLQNGQEQEVLQEKGVDWVTELHALEEHQGEGGKAGDGGAVGGEEGGVGGSCQKTGGKLAAVQLSRRRRNIQVLHFTSFKQLTLTSACLYRPVEDTQSLCKLTRMKKTQRLGARLPALLATPS